MRAALVIAVLVVGGVVGCASGQGVLRLEPQPDALYEHPLEEVWPAVRSWFQQGGFRLREDEGHFVLQTEWREEFPGSTVAGYWHRYTVIGKRVSPSRSQVWILHSSRSPEGAPANETKPLDWEGNRAPDRRGDGMPGKGLRVEEMDVNMPALEPASRFVSEVSVANVQLSSEASGAAGEAVGGSRDSTLEMRVRDLLAPELDAKKRGTEEAALASARQEPGAASLECGLSILGLAGRAQRGAVLLLGELHGTQEVPRFVALSACQVTARGLPLTVGLELPVDNQERVRRFIASAGTEEDRARLMEGSFWRSPYPDGRGSEAVARMLEQLRWLRAQGMDVQVFVFDHPELQGEAREAAMARSVIAEVEAEPQRFFLVLAGNIHPRTRPGVPWDLGYRPMGYLLARKLPGLLSLDVAFNSGTAWICSVEETLECGVRPTRGQDNGNRFFISLFDRPSESGFHGVFYVGAVSASPPAVQVRTGAPTEAPGVKHP